MPHEPGRRLSRLEGNLPAAFKDDFRQGCWVLLLACSSLLLQFELFLYANCSNLLAWRPS